MIAWQAPGPAGGGHQNHHHQGGRGRDQGQGHKREAPGQYLPSTMVKIQLPGPRFYVDCKSSWSQILRLEPCGPTINAAVEKETQTLNRFYAVGKTEFSSYILRCDERAESCAIVDSSTLSLEQPQKALDIVLYFVESRPLWLIKNDLMRIRIPLFILMRILI